MSKRTPEQIQLKYNLDHELDLAQGVPMRAMCECGRWKCRGPRCWLCVIEKYNADNSTTCPESDTDVEEEAEDGTPEGI